MANAPPSPLRVASAFRARPRRAHACRPLSGAQRLLPARVRPDQPIHGDAPELVQLRQPRPKAAGLLHLSSSFEGRRYILLLQIAYTC